ncbi:hypothetical protein N7449_009305 [Penicillium cf. viridicatum]|uniref:Uncharacterized protein n=1 Tax=Penicillium cf. viridicatum TaxID=2972119 RepID=A0A9W9M8X8_9EURO|nr:hypothetical protein N7449_009305 [Penicillium cf. viridicatum]
MATLPSALAGFANMFGVGTVYAASTFQEQLPRLLGISQQSSYAPFALACLGLSIGVALSRYHSLGGSSHLCWPFLSYRSFAGILLSFFFGGIGVGLTYLAVVILIGQAFPNHALAKSAIGPLGFSSGASVCIYLGLALNFDSLSAEDLGRLVALGGAGCVSIGASTGFLMATTYKARYPTREKSQSIQGKIFFSVLLFFNALPGMKLFGALLPIVSSHAQGSSMHFLPFSLIVLTAGGFLAPSLNTVLGSERTFALLFCLRGCLLVLVSLDNEPGLAFLAFLAILFSHGAGFSIIPDLVKAKSQLAAHFPHHYSQVLISWGLAGAVGYLINALSLVLPEARVLLDFSVGLVTLLVGLLLCFVSSP